MAAGKTKADTIWARQRTRMEAHPSVKMKSILVSHGRARLADARIGSRDNLIRSILAAKLGRGFASALDRAVVRRVAGVAERGYCELGNTRLALVTSVTKLLPGWPVPAPTSSLPVVSCTPCGGLPTTVNW